MNGIPHHAETDYYQFVSEDLLLSENFYNKILEEVIYTISCYLKDGSVKKMTFYNYDDRNYSVVTEKGKCDFVVRKKKIDATIHSNLYPWYNNLHQYSKNKIHCSCDMCSSKYRKHDKHTKKTKLYMFEEIKSYAS